MSDNHGNGNAAAMRDALGMVLRYLQWLYAQGCTDRGRLSDEIDRVVSAINEPPRNCDVGTAEEQAMRFDAFVRDRRGDLNCTGKCPAHHGVDFGVVNCVLQFAQMPYDMEDENAQK